MPKFVGRYTGLKFRTLKTTVDQTYQGFSLDFTFCYCQLLKQGGAVCGDLVKYLSKFKNLPVFVFFEKKLSNRSAHFMGGLLQLNNFEFLKTALSQLLCVPK